MMTGDRYTPDHVRAEELKGAILQAVDAVPDDVDDPGHIDRPFRRSELEAIYDEVTDP